MSEAADPQTDAAVNPSAAQPRSTTPKRDTVAAIVAQQARHESNTSTPRRPRTNGKLEEITKLRHEIAPQMDGEFMECSVETFVEHYLPFRPKDKDVEKFITEATYSPELAAAARNPNDAVRARRAAEQDAPAPPPQYRADQVLYEEDGELRFVDYPGVLPTTAGETTTYSYLQRIMDAIANATVDGRTRNGFQYRPCPGTVVKSEIPGANNKIDGCIISGANISPKGELNLTTFAVAVAFEYMLESNTKPESDNNLQEVSANVQIMNDDVRRMFAYGVTIVGAEVRLWYHGRSHSAVSEPFDFVEDPTTFVKVMMSFLFATEVELGYDDKITRLEDGRLVFELEDSEGNPVFYRTVRTLSEYRSNNITGRMTRVWEVERVSEPSKTADALWRGVLKDVWLDDDSPTERQVQESIFQAIEDGKTTIGSNYCIQKLESALRDRITNIIENGTYKDYFLTIVTDRRGRVSKAVAPGAKRKRGLLIPELQPAKRLRSGVNVSRTQSYVQQPTQLEQWNAARRAFIPREFRPKRQYRVVYAELCATVGSLNTLGQVLDVLTQTLTALQLLYFAGWVHRDISSGNVMAHVTGGDPNTPVWQAKLCDLEYAKKYTLNPTEASQDPKTGTPYFMPHEILFGKPLLPKKSSSTQAADPAKKDFFSQFAAGVGQVEARPSVRAPTLQVIPNFQHDLESIWWLTVYSVTARVDHPPSKQFAQEVFKHTTELDHHRALFLEEEITESFEATLHPNISSIWLALEPLRQGLLDEYKARNEKRLLDATKKDSDSDMESYVKIHNSFYTVFKAMVDLYKAKPNFWNHPLINEEVQEIVNVMPPQPRKRARSTRNDDDDDYQEESDAAEDESNDEQPKKRERVSKKLKRTGKSTKTT